MRAATVLTSIILAPLVAACGGLDDGTLCDHASQHVAACTGRAAPAGASAACDDRSAALAAQLLELDCSGVRSLMANVGGGKADSGGCLAPWDCPEQYPSMDEPCGLADVARCQGYCDAMMGESDYMRLRKVSCEVLDGGVAHCQCKGYWLPWPKGDPDEPAEEPDPGQPDEEPTPEEPDPGGP